MRKIEAVYDNADKERTYRQNCAKYKKAIQEEFYFEAMLIAYAMMEDRLRSFLYHIGALEKRDSIRVKCNKTKNQLRELVSKYKNIRKKDNKNKENDSLGISNITGKMKVIRCSLIWASTVDSGYENDNYLKVLKNQYEGNIDIQELLDLFYEIEDWIDYRNEIIHALLNKNIDSLTKELKEKTLQGMELARRLDNFVHSVKKRNYIRRSINLFVEK